MERPGGVTVLAVLAFVLAALCFLGGLSSFVASGLGIGTLAQQPGLGIFLRGLGVFAGVSLLVLAGLYFAAGFGLWTLKSWGRMLTIVLIALGLLLAAMGLVNSLLHLHVALILWQLLVCALDIWILVYLFKPQVRQAFGA